MVNNLFIAIAIWYVPTTGQIAEIAIIDDRPTHLNDCMELAAGVNGDGAVGACIDIGEFTHQT